jgi:hypothetical protein
MSLIDAVAPAVFMFVVLGIPTMWRDRAASDEAASDETAEARMSGPTRVQRKRTKGWRMPPNTLYVGRPTVWGNEFTATMLDVFDRPLGRQRAVDLYEAATLRWVEDYDDREAVEAFVAPLRGKNLACWCPLDQPCHADVLLELTVRMTHEGAA